MAKNETRGRKMKKDKLIKKENYKQVYYRFEKLAKRLRKEGKELDANEFWKFLILELRKVKEG